MELKEVLLKRRSIRSFTDQAVSDADVDYLLHAAMSGPSAMNFRPWEFYVIKDPAKISELNEVGHAKYKSPLIIVVGGNSLRLVPLVSQLWIEDTSAATENILLAATDLGLGAVWCAVFPSKHEEKQVSKILDLPKHIIPLNIIVIGHPSGEIPSPRDQYDEKFVHKI
jgi:nitroreductase